MPAEPSRSNSNSSSSSGGRNHHGNEHSQSHSQSHSHHPSNNYHAHGHGHGHHLNSTKGPSAHGARSGGTFRPRSPPPPNPGLASGAGVSPQLRPGGRWSVSDQKPSSNAARKEVRCSTRSQSFFYSYLGALWFIVYMFSFFAAVYSKSVTEGNEFGIQCLLFTRAVTFVL